MDLSVLAVILYGTDCFAVRLGVECTISRLRSDICSNWVSLSNIPFELSFIRDSKRSLLETDSELQSLVCFCSVKGSSSVDIDVKLSNGCSSGVIGFVDYPTSNSLCSGVYEGEFEVSRPRKSNIWASLITGVGQCFTGGAEEFRNKLLMYSLEKGFKFVLIKNDTKRVTVVCSFKDSLSCCWKIHATQKYNICNLFEIKSMNDHHTCGSGFMDINHPPMTSKLVKSLVKDTLRDRPLMKPKEVIDMFLRDFGLKLNYYYAYNGLLLARNEIYGDEAESYQQLVWYTDVIKKTNPGSSVILEKDVDGNKFKRVFASFEASIHGFRFLRPLLFLDGTHLKAKYKGCMLGATAKNGDQGFFTLAMAIVLAENEDNWTWFLENLKRIIPVDKLPITFVSDRHLGLLSSIPKVFPESFHGYCFWHMKNNIRDSLPGRSKNRPDVVKLFKKCAYAATHSEFQSHLKLMIEIGGTLVKKFLDNAPFEHWANAYFRGYRYGEMCSNLAECFNSWITEQRNLPVTAMLHEIRKKIMTMMSKRREASAKWKSVLCPTMEEVVSGKIDVGRTWKVLKSSEFKFEVLSDKSHSVNLRDYSCSCNLWCIEGFPCAHAIQCILYVGESVYRFVDPHFYADSFRLAYSHCIEPISDFEIVEEKDEDSVVAPPDVKRQPGRPRKKRIPNRGAIRGRPSKRGKCYGYR